MDRWHLSREHISFYTSYLFQSEPFFAVRFIFYSGSSVTIVASMPVFLCAFCNKNNFVASPQY